MAQGVTLHSPPSRRLPTSPSQETRTRAVSPSWRFRPAVSRLHITRRPGRRRGLGRRLVRQGRDEAIVRPSALVADPGTLHPPPRVHGLASHHRLARVPVREPRWDADQHLDVGPLGAARLPARARSGVTARAARGRVPDLGRQRAPLRRRPVAVLLPRLPRRVAATAFAEAASATGQGRRAPTGPVRGRPARPPPPSSARAPTRARSAAAGVETPCPPGWR